MEIIKCSCGHYKMLDDELCPVCKADFSTGAEYELLEDQEQAHQRWSALGGEEQFNKYMKSINGPKFMLCPECKFKMLISETKCPKCGLPVKYVPGKKVKQPLGIRILDAWTKFLWIKLAVAAFFILIFIIFVIYGWMVLI